MNFKDNVKYLSDRFQKKFTTTWASSLAFYTSLSLAPLLILFLIVTSQLNPQLQQLFINQINLLMGENAATAIVAILESAKSRPDLISFSGFISLATLLFSASLIFGELRAALNLIFENPVTQDEFSFWQTTWFFFKARFFQMGLVLGFLFIIIVSLIVSTFISSTFTGATALDAVVNISASYLIYIFLFSILFHYVPQTCLPWKRSIQGGAITSFLFIIGKELIGIYLGNSAFSSSYGAAGSLVVLLVWVYYSAIIIFVGAHISFMLHEKEQDSMKNY